jgi:hypothetical protein
VPQEPIRELLDLAAVHSFFISFLEHVLVHPVPVPHEIMQAQKGAASPEQAQQSVAILRGWLDLLDLAITPPMVRDALKESTRPGTAEALLRYFVLKRSAADADRDKADFISTFLFRALGETPRPVPQTQDNFGAMPALEPSPRFEQEVCRILAAAEVPTLPEEHVQLVREFDFVRTEVEDFHHFDRLMDSGMMQRVRDIKHAFGVSFYHPRVLATVAEYNVYFGQRFDELFRNAAKEIKKFADNAQQQGGSIMSRVEGNVTVKQLADVQEEHILHQEYGRAKEEFRKISQFKKVVDRRRSRAAEAPAPGYYPAVPPPAAAFGSEQGTAAPAMAHLPQSTRPATMNAAPGRALSETIEEGKIHSVQESIRNFVRVADPKSSQVVPMRNGNINLSAAEADAFRADFLNEKSFRGEFANMLVQIVAVQVRMIGELEDFKSKQHSAYLWKPHADALAFLLTVSKRTMEAATHVLEIANQRGLQEKLTAMHASLQKLRMQGQLVAKTLQALDVQNGG